MHVNVHGNRRVWNWIPWRSQGGGGIRAMPPKGQSPGTNISFASQTEAWTWTRFFLDPLGPLAEVDFLSGFRAPRDGSGPAGRIRALQNEPGPRGMDPQDASGSRNTDQGPAGQIRDHGTDQGLAIRIGDLQDGSGPRTSNQGPHDA